VENTTLGSPINRDVLGTLIDAIYAIAVTILALEVPGDFGEVVTASSGAAEGPGDFHEFLNYLDFLVQYAVSFFILFALWMQHRRIIQLVDPEKPLILWSNATILLLICLIPRATTLVFNYGDDVTWKTLVFSGFDYENWSRAELVDLFYIALVMAADFGLLLLLWLSSTSGESGLFRSTWHSKLVVTFTTTMVLVLSLIMPVENRYFLLMMPLALMFERSFLRLWIGPAGAAPGARSLPSDRD